MNVCVAGGSRFVRLPSCILGAVLFLFFVKMVDGKSRAFPKSSTSANAYHLPIWLSQEFLSV